MKTSLAIMLLLIASLVRAENEWKTVDEGFRMTIPVDWQKQKVQPIDSNCGTYKAETVDLEFDEVFRLGYTAEKAQSLIDELKEKEAKLQNSLASVVGKEYEATQSQVKLLDQKLKDLEKRLANLKESETSLGEALDVETKRTATLRASLAHETSLLENLIKQ